jgi:5-methylcytosine-specific restriction endonuclease McrA
MIAEINLKICTKCKEAKPFSEFGKAKLGKDGLRAICKKCHSAEGSQRQSENKEQYSAYGKIYREREKDRISEQRAIHTAQNRTRLAEYGKQWAKDNPGKVNAKTARRRAARIKAMPKWLTKVQHQEMEALYVEAARLTKETGIPHEVDHIVPLQGKKVRGLHVPWNLRVITQEDNRRKSRKYAI